MTSKLHSILKNREAKTLASNFVWLSLLQFAGYVFPLLTMPYLARVIGVTGFGKIAFAAAIMAWIQTVADWGFNYTATRDVAKNRDNHQMVSKIFSSVLWARIFLMFLSFFFLLILIAVIPQFRNSADIILVTFLLIPGHILFPEWFFQAMERMKYITILNLTAKLIFTIAVFIVIKDENDYIYQPLLTSLGFIVSGVISMHYILHKWRIKIYAPCWSDILMTLKGSADVFLNNLMPNLYNSFSTILLGIYFGNKANGILDAGSKFISIVSYFINVISRTFFPFLSRKINHHKKFVIINLSVSISAAISLYILSPLLIEWFYTDAFGDAIIVCRILSLSIIFYAINSIYGTNYLILEGYEKPLRNITFISSIIGFAISFPLIYYYSFIGAALTICITRGILSILIYFYSRTVQLKNSQK